MEGLGNYRRKGGKWKKRAGREKIRLEKGDWRRQENIIDDGGDGGKKGFATSPSSVLHFPQKIL